MIGVGLATLSGIQARSFHFGAFDPAHWHGLVMIRNDAATAFRFIVHRRGRTVDGYDSFYIVEDVGPRSPDGSYASVSFNPTLPLHREGDTPILEKNPRRKGLFTLQYGGYGEGVVGQVTIPAGVRVDVFFYHPWSRRGRYRLRENRVTLEGDPDFRFFSRQMSLRGIEEDEALRVAVSPRCREFFFYAGFADRSPSSDQVRRILVQNREAYRDSRPRVEGEWAGLVESITHNLSWMVLWQPDHNRRYLPAGRRWIFPRPDGKRDTWTLFEWDAFFNALEATVDNYSLARDEIKAVLDTQYPWGNIPNWRSASNGSPDRAQPPVGAFAVWKTYLKSKDREMLAESYSSLKKFHAFWKYSPPGEPPGRDGNQNRLLEWGSDTERIPEGIPSWEKDATGRQRAAWESGQDDLPNFDGVPFSESTGTLMMDCIDLNALYILDTEMMRNIARELGNVRDTGEFDREYREMVQAVNRTLWHPGKNFYFDRFWEGHFSTRKAASNFYPLIAGVPDRQQAQKMVERLQDEDQFWGDYVIPTISREDPAFPDQQYWRGTIWPPTNYLVYQGLKRYRFDEIASRFAVKSARLFLRSWNRYRLCRENYNSITGEGGGQRYQSWGPLFALILLEDFIDCGPFGGFRVGNLSARRPSTLQNISMQGKKYRLEVDRDRLRLWENGRPLIGYRGRGVIRNLKIREGVLHCRIDVYSDSLDFTPDVFGPNGFRILLNQRKPVVNHSRSFRLPRGGHDLEMREMGPGQGGEKP